MRLLLTFFLIFHVGKSLEIVDNIKQYKSLVNSMSENTQQSNIEQLITDILYDSVRSIKCFALICDPMYCDMFTSKMFRKFKIQIDESEDLLSPYAETQATLKQIEVEKCKFYVILIANAIQVSRFLRFGDRYRLLNTRSNFILLYDIRLFHTELHYVWSRIVNVVFIREYGGHSHNRNGAAVPWFDVSTVPFPTPIRGVFISRRLDTWRRGHFRLGVNLFRDKTSDLQNQTLKVVTFEHIPATVKTLKSFTNETPSTDAFIYSGVEVQILKTLAQQMNFQPHIYEPSNADVEKWGQKRDGKFSGVLGEMVRFRAEIALADLYYSPYHLELMDLSIPYNTECLTFLTPESTTDNSWMTLVLPFKLYMWLTVILVLFVVGCILYALAKFQRHLYEMTSKRDACVIITEKVKSAGRVHALLNSPFKYLEFRTQEITVARDEDTPSGLHLFAEPFNSFLYTYSMLLLVSLPKVPDGWSLRMIVGWYFLYCTLVVVSYKASMTAILANPAPRITIDSLTELERSDLACGGWADNKEFFLTSLDVAGQKIGARFESVNESDAAIERVASGQFAYYENVYYLKAASVDRQMRIENNNNDSVKRDNKDLHIMSHCVINMPISLGLQKNSPIKPKVDVFIRRVMEGGFVTKWLDDTMQPTLNSEIYTGSQQSLALMNLGKLYCGFVALFIGYAITTFPKRTYPCLHNYLKRTPLVLLCTEMGGVVSTGHDNDDLINNLLHAGYIKTTLVERVFRAVDRADYFLEEARSNAYKDLAWKSGNLHLSAPCIYSEVMEGLLLAPGMSFLNLGSGTGYLSTMVGLILGPYGINHGIEIHDDVVQYANKKLEEFKKYSTALDEYEFCAPKFTQGNCLCLNSEFPQYDRVYCGAACPENHENYIKNFVKVGGVLVMPLNDKLLQIKRTSETTWEETFLLSVSFASCIAPVLDQHESVKMLDFEPLTLQTICRSTIRSILRENIDLEHPDLKKTARNPPKRPKKKRALRRLVVPIIEEYDFDNSDTTDEEERRDLARAHLLPDRSNNSSSSRDINAILDQVFHLSQWSEERKTTDVDSQTVAAGVAAENLNTITEEAVLNDEDGASASTVEEQKLCVSKREKFDSGLGEDLLNERGHSSDSEMTSDSEDNSSTNCFRADERLNRLARSVRRLRNIVDDDSDSDMIVEESVAAPVSRPVYTSPYTPLMRAKIQVLPLPPMLKQYLNLYREF
ncbi:Ionotropic receptor 68a [Carabus blaptoides fortunei]